MWDLTAGRSCGVAEGREIRTVSERHIRYSVDQSLTQGETQRASSGNPATLHKLVIPVLFGANRAFQDSPPRNISINKRRG